MPVLKNQITKSVIVKIRGNDKPMTATVTNIEESYGVWLTSDALTKELMKTGLPEHLKMPDVFVPFENLEWMMTPSNPKT